MSEENKEKIVEVEENEKENTASDAEQKSNRPPLYIALAVIGVVILGALLILVFRGREGGKVVPAPPSMTFNENENQEPSMPTEEQTITLEPEQVERIGLKIETVGETMLQDAASVASTGVVQPNAYNQTPVISLVGGVVHRINAQLGENVSRGQAVAAVLSDESAMAQSRYLSLQTEAQTARQNYERASKLVKINPVSRSELDEAQAKLKTREAELDETQRRYHRTVKLVEIGASSREELERDRTKLKTAEAESEQSRKQYNCTSEIAEINPVSRSEFEQAAVKLRTAETEFASAKQRLLLLGLSEQKVNSLRSASQISSELALIAPVSGTITSRVVNQGETIEATRN